MLVPNHDNSVHTCHSFGGMTSLSRTQWHHLNPLLQMQDTLSSSFVDKLWLLGTFLHYQAAVCHTHIHAASPMQCLQAAAAAYVSVQGQVLCTSAPDTAATSQHCRLVTAHFCQNCCQSVVAMRLTKQLGAFAECTLCLGTISLLLHKTRVCKLALHVC